MSTEDDRPGFSGGYSDGGTLSFGGSGYSRSGGAHARYEPDRFGGIEYDDSDFDEGFDSGPPPVSTLDSGGYDDEDEVRRTRPIWHGGLDFGLLALRLVLGGTFVAHGLQKLFGLLDGPGINGFANLLQGIGFKQSTVLAWVTGGAELGGGALLVLGLFTPLGAAAVLGVMANVIYLKWGTGFFLGFVTTESGPKVQGFEWELALAGAAFALMFTGPGRVSLDRPTPWFRNPVPFAMVCLILAAGLTAATQLAFR